MSEKKKLFKKYKEELKQLQERCLHEKTVPYSNHFIEKSEYCEICGKVINIIYRKGTNTIWDDSYD